MGEELVKRLGLDSLPDLAGRRVSELADLSGRVAAVTGGGGRVLGGPTVDRLASQGATVAVIDLDQTAAERSAADANDRWGVEARPFVGDIRRWDECHRLAAEIHSTWGRLDVWVNNVGGAGYHGKFLEMDEAGIRGVLERNLMSATYCCHAAGEIMVGQGSGRIINVASEGGKIALENIVFYNACKSAVIGLTRNLARELGAHGVRVVAVCPGIMAGPEAVKSMRELDDSGSRAQTLLSSISRTSMPRASVPEEVANVIAFLASDAASYVDGTAVSVGGGLAD
jgi:3-oxoacyl-[acyl-carrier protein] reductase